MDNKNNDECRCCEGRGVQRSGRDGMYVACPECRGTGKWSVVMAIQRRIVDNQFTGEDKLAEWI